MVPGQASAKFPLAVTLADELGCAEGSDYFAFVPHQPGEHVRLRTVGEVQRSGISQWQVAGGTPCRRRGLNSRHNSDETGMFCIVLDWVGCISGSVAGLGGLGGNAYALRRCPPTTPAKPVARCPGVREGQRASGAPPRFGVRDSPARSPRRSAGNDDDGQAHARLANPLDEFHAREPRHFVVGDQQVVGSWRSASQARLAVGNRR